MELFRRNLIVIIFLLLGLMQSGRTQPTFFGHDLAPQVIIDGQALANPWAGGFNSPQFSSIHLNDDDKIDLILFDKTGSRLLTFVAEEKNGAYTYIYAPEYEFMFPKFFAWVLLRDYNGDGRKDIFTHTAFGVKVYKNKKEPNKVLNWELVVNPIRTQGYSGLVNLQINALDVPSIVDLDDDGDMDIVTFDFVQGSYLEYHKNMSVENTGQAEEFLFKRYANCWGDLFEGQECGEFSFDLNCKRNKGGGEPPRVMHIGSTITIQDLNGDNKKDVLIGDVSCPYLYKMLNVKSNEQAKFQKYDIQFPKSKPVDLFIFPAAYFEDINFDNKADLLVSPNSFTNEGQRINFHQSAWYYENIGSEKKPRYDFRTNAFLQNTMIDLGENAAPALLDYDGDGDADLFVGYKGMNQGDDFWASLYLFENIGDPRYPVFELKDKDFFNLSTFKYKDIRPFFVDLDGDQKLDLAFTASDPQGKAVFAYIHNEASDVNTFEASTPSALTKMNLPLNKLDLPCFVDSDQDGDLDLIVGKRDGSLAYYKNDQENYTLITKSLGGIKADFRRRELCPSILDINQDGKLDLLTGDASGQVLIYENILEKLEETWTAQKDLFSNAANEQFTPYHFGASTYPSTADLNGDKLLDLVVGTNGGGLQIFKNLSF